MMLLFAVHLIGLSGKYHEAVRNVANGEYETALTEFEELDGYQDSEVLAEYCRVMAEYDADNYPSVFRSYHRLNDLTIDNDDLAVEIASTRAEINALYIHCGE